MTFVTALGRWSVMVRGFLLPTTTITTFFLHVEKAEKQLYKRVHLFAFSQNSFFFSVDLCYAMANAIWPNLSFAKSPFHESGFFSSVCADSVVEVIR